MSEHVPVWIIPEDNKREDEGDFVFRMTYDEIRGLMCRAVAIRQAQSEHYLSLQLDKLTPLEDE